MNPHHQQRSNDRDVADAIDEKAPAFVGGRDQQSRQRGADESRRIHHGRVDGDGVGEVGAILDHLDHERLAAGHVERVDDALHGAQRQHLGDGDAMREREPRQRERLHHGERLRPHQHFAAVDAIDDDTRKGREQKGGYLAGEADGAEQKRRLGEPVDQP